MVKPVYPKKYRKITPAINKIIHKMYNDGFLQIEIARRFNLSSSTITKTLHERSRRIALANSRMHTKEYRKDPEYRAKINEAIRINVNKRYHNDKKYKKFLIDYSVIDKQKRKEYLKEYRRLYYQRKRKELQLIKRKNFTINKHKQEHTKRKIGEKR